MVETRSQSRGRPATKGGRKANGPPPADKPEESPKEKEPPPSESEGGEGQPKEQDDNGKESTQTEERKPFLRQVRKVKHLWSQISTALESPEEHRLTVLREQLQIHSAKLDGLLPPDDGYAEMQHEGISFQCEDLDLEIEIALRTLASKPKTATSSPPSRKSQSTPTQRPKKAAQK